MVQREKQIKGRGNENTANLSVFSDGIFWTQKIQKTTDTRIREFSKVTRYASRVPKSYLYILATNRIKSLF